MALDLDSIDRHYRNGHSLPEVDDLCNVVLDSSLVCLRRGGSITRHATEPTTAVDDAGVTVIPARMRSRGPLVEQGQRVSVFSDDGTITGPFGGIRSMHYPWIPL